MTTTRFHVSHLLSGAAPRRTLGTALVAALALVFVPAVLAQESDEARESDEKERSVRVMVLGDGKVEILEDTENARVLTEGLVASAASAQDRAQREMVGHGDQEDLPPDERGAASAGRVRPTLAVLWGGAYLGVELVNLNEPLRAHFGVPEGSGVLVSNVVDGSPAARAGVQVGDILTRFNGKDVKSSRRLVSMVRRAESGDQADLEIWRDGRVETLGATLDERPRPVLRSDSFSFSFRGREDLDGDGEIDVFVAPEDLHEKIQEYFNGDEWKERHEHVQRFLHERRPDMKVLEDRLEALKKRLAELEQRLEDRHLDNEN